jgi:hypothetical protein
MALGLRWRPYTRANAASWRTLKLERAAELWEQDIKLYVQGAVRFAEMALELRAEHARLERWPNP